MDRQVVVRIQQHLPKIQAVEGDTLIVGHPVSQKSRSYAEARKMRADFRKRLVEVIMHRDENDDSDEEPAHPGAPLTTKEKDLLRCVTLHVHEAWLMLLLLLLSGQTGFGPIMRFLFTVLIVARQNMTFFRSEFYLTNP